MPEQLTRFPLPNTSRIAFRPFNLSLRLNVKRSKSGEDTLIGLLLVGNGQLVSALGAAALEDKPSTSGTHARPKSKFPITLYLTRLICAFHCSYSLPSNFYLCDESLIIKI
jgi:hypothetical protein